MQENIKCHKFIPNRGILKNEDGTYKEIYVSNGQILLNNSTSEELLLPIEHSIYDVIADKYFIFEDKRLSIYIDTLYTTLLFKLSMNDTKMSIIQKRLNTITNNLIKQHYNIQVS